MRSQNMIIVINSLLLRDRLPMTFKVNP